jgi:hypothetical protein
MENRLYKIRDGIPFRTGILPDGTQLLVSRFGSDAIAIRFSTTGEFIGFDQLWVGPEIDVPDSKIAEIVNRLCVAVDTIRVQRFALPEYSIEIRDMPDYLQEYVDAPSSFPEERAYHLRKVIADWNRRSSFVLVWCEDYEMSQEGFIESS